MGLIEMISPEHPPRAYTKGGKFGGFVLISNPAETFISEATRLNQLIEDSISLAENGSIHVDGDPFPKGTLVTYALPDVGLQGQEFFGIVMYRLSRNGWYVVLDENGFQDVVGDIMMKKVD